MIEKNIILSAPLAGSFSDRLDHLYSQVREWLTATDGGAVRLLYTRAYLSDVMGQLPMLLSHPLYHQILSQGAFSYVEQPPLCGCKIALLLSLVPAEAVQPLEPTSDQLDHDGKRAFRIGDDLLLFHSVRLSDREAAGLSVKEQTERCFEHHIDWLASEGMTLRDNCLRTWLYVRDIDHHYAAVVQGRNEIFRREGLTRDTHFIASTGISGNTVSPAPIGIDFLSVKSASIRTKFLQAPDYLNPTYQYGVAFERGTSVDLHGVKRLFISGTASIDKEGKCLYIGDVRKQAERLLTNIDQLLKADGSSLDRLSYLIVYLRDLSDYSLIQHYLSERFPHLPMLITLAPVCRSQWLIECEGMAIQSTPNY